MGLPWPSGEPAQETAGTNGGAQKSQKRHVGAMKSRLNNDGARSGGECHRLRIDPNGILHHGGGYRAILNPIARRVAGVGYSVRREALYSLADLRATQNR